MRLFSYKLTYDTGFAPNPFHGVLSLATCKPGIRSTKQVGDWLAGFASVELSRQAAAIGVPISPEALIYLARITEILPIQRYFEDPRFEQKIPPKAVTGDFVASSGDNIYKPLWVKDDGKYEFEQISQIYHDERHMQDDLGGHNVLICEEFYYLGRAGKDIPYEIEISRPSGPARFGYKTESIAEITKLVQWTKSLFKPGINGNPCLWQASDMSCSVC